MDKPDDVPQWAWDDAFDVAYDISSDGYGGVEYHDARVSIAKAILKAKNDALNRAITEVNSFHHGYTDQGTEGNYRREADVCSHIAQAIRNLKHKEAK